jgi:hypothetical protein
LSNAQLASLGSAIIGAGLVWWASRRPTMEPNVSAAPAGKAA